MIPFPFSCHFTLVFFHFFLFSRSHFLPSDTELFTKITKKLHDFDINRQDFHTPHNFLFSNLSNNSIFIETLSDIHNMTHFSSGTRPLIFNPAETNTPAGKSDL